MRLPAPVGRYKLHISILAVCLFAACFAWELQGRYQQVAYVSVMGTSSATQRTEILRRLSELNRPGDIRSIKGYLEEAEWIHHVDVERNWPDGVIITVHEEVAIAYWNDDAFVNEEGEIFQSPYQDGGPLPQLYGPEGREKAVMSQYQQLGQALLRTGQSIDTLVLDERGGWEFTTRSGMQVLLGKDDIMERMQRYFLVLQRAGLTEEMEKIRSVDTRYADGVAVSWKDAMEGYEVAKAYKTQREMSL